jgi:hypothetical protein
MAVWCRLNREAVSRVQEVMHGFWHVTGLVVVQEVLSQSKEVHQTWWLEQSKLPLE